MKKYLVFFFLVCAIVCKAQEGPPPQPTKEQQQKHLEMMQKQLQLNQSQQIHFDQVMKDFMSQAEELHKNNSLPPPPPMDPKIKAAMDKIVKDRDEKLKKILTDEQFKKFMDQEKNMHHPPHRGGPHKD